MLTVFLIASVINLLGNIEVYNELCVSSLNIPGLQIIPRARAINTCETRGPQSVGLVASEVNKLQGSDLTGS